MSHTLSVSILDREYRLRVNREEDAVLTARIAEYVDQKMRAFRQAHPDRPEATTAVITALAIAEDLFLERERVERMLDSFDQEASRAADDLEEALESSGLFGGMFTEQA